MIWMDFTLQYLKKSPIKIATLFYLFLSLPCLAGEESSLDFSNFSELRLFFQKTLAGAHEKIFIASKTITDPEIATSLFSSQLRKVEVKIILEKKSQKNPYSKLKYFIENQVPVFLVEFKPVRELQNNTFLMVDNNSWLIDTPLSHLDLITGNKEKNSTRRAIKVSSLPHSTSGTLMEFMQKAPSEIPVLPEAPSTPRPRESTAKTQTDDIRQPVDLSGNLSGNRRSSGSIQKRLPRETRMQRYLKGERIHDTLVPIDSGLKKLPEDEPAKNDKPVEELLTQ